MTAMRTPGVPSLEVAAAMHVLHLLMPEELPAIAVEAFMAGRSSNSLAALAGESSTADPRGLRDLFLGALDETGVGLPARRAAADELKRWIVGHVLAGTLGPGAGARWIVDVLEQCRSEWSSRLSVAAAAWDVEAIVNLFFELDDLAPGDHDDRGRLEELLRAEFRRIGGDAARV